MSYSAGLGQTALQTAVASQLRPALSPTQVRQATTSTTRSVVESTAMEAIRASKQITPPAYCGTYGSMLEGIRFPVAGAQLAPGHLYVAVWPLLTKLSTTQAQQLDQRFAEAMDPVAAAYPAKTMTPCSLTFRRADACICRDRKNPARHKPHHPSAVGNSFSVQSCMKGEATRLARHWISFFHNLYGWTDFPFGYKEVNGDPVFVWPIEMNPDSKKEFYSRTGAVLSGDMRAKRMPSLPLVQVRNYAQAKLKGAMSAIGLKAGQVSPGLVLHVDRFDAAPLAVEHKYAKRFMEQVQASPTIKGTVPAERTLGWDSALYRRAVRHPGDKTAQAYKLLIDKALGQAAAYARESTTAVWQTVGSLLVGSLVSRGTDTRLRGIYATAWRRNQAFAQAAVLVTNAERLSSSTEAEARGLLALPDPKAAYPVLKSLRAEVVEAIKTVEGAMAGLPHSPGYVSAVFTGAANAASIVQRGFQTSLRKLDDKAKTWATPLRQKWTCMLYRKAANEQHKWPLKMMDMGDELKASIGAFAAVSSSAPAAIARFREVIATIDYVVEQLGLSWWQKDYGPLPGWAWGGLGVAGLFGGALYIRKTRRGRPRKNPPRLPRRTSRRR
jgi:hypothetical protein